jgi:uncharacterized protein YdbL (DUF1318 family)
MRSAARRLVLVLALSWAGSAAALDLDTAKSQGLVGERTDGYVAAVASAPSADVQALVADVNAKRKTTYDNIAQQNGTDVDKVAALAAQKVLAKAPPGTWILDSGRWYQKR